MIPGMINFYYLRRYRKFRRKNGRDMMKFEKHKDRRPHWPHSPFYFARRRRKP